MCGILGFALDKNKTIADYVNQLKFNAVDFFKTHEKELDRTFEIFNRTIDYNKREHQLHSFLPCAFGVTTYNKIIARLEKDEKFQTYIYNLVDAITFLLNK